MNENLRMQVTSGFLPTIASAVLFSLPVTVSAASITINPIVAGTSGSVILEPGSTYVALQVSPNLVKVTGEGNYTATGQSSVITLALGGLLSAESGDPLSLDYDFTLNLTGSGSLNWTFTSALTVFGFQVPGPSSSGGPVTTADNGTFTGNKSDNVPIDGIDVPWSATLTVNWTGAAPNDTLRVTIPTNSIDIAVVPEPSSFLLLGVSGLFLTRRRR